MSDKTKELQAGSSDPWISVDERLPSNDDYVLVYVPKCNRKVWMDCWRMQKEQPVNWSTRAIETGPAWDEWEFEDVTHWMPMPAAPIDNT